MIAQIDKEFWKISKRKSFTRLFCYLLEGRPLTTKGRVFNKILSIYFRTLSSKRSAKVQIAYIIGIGRSGTTILGKTLGMHKDIAFLNEPKAIWAYAYKHEDIIGSYNTHIGKLVLTEEESNSKTRSLLTSFYRNVLRLTGNTLVVDKYPELVFRIGFVKSLFPNAKFIFLYRNPFETLNSIYKWSEQHRAENKRVKNDWWGLNNRKWEVIKEELILPSSTYSNMIPMLTKYDSDPLSMAAIEWIVTMDYGIFVIHKYSKDVLLIDYNELVENKHRCVHMLCEFLGVNSDPNVFSYVDASINKRNRDLDCGLDGVLLDHIRRIEKTFIKMLKRE